ncbi:cysteine--tRNA ligase [Dictyobacter formicarum]|uniref:Cysteine--tRNA ligase n=1 Tax=Dictyobacter formicarum TaxID=2778368 RepID=A0ABQ3VLW6_9CHLR|nr:cysteine--tRNA ligase [Dictyobacter formicarum]GHO86676.1 cysteine--tRNA ligase [Dictyobacter formicarum]
MKLFNTLTQSLQEFKPINDTVTIYVCGVTPYDTTHLGHAFTYVTFDTLIRYLEYKGYPVKYVQNVTDIDDDVIRKAGELGMAWDELGNREMERFLSEMDSLNWRRPDVYARATDEIERIIELARTLVARGLAYESEGCVFYSVRQDKDFGKMAQAVGLNDYQSMLAIANERGNFPDDKRKRDPLDFVLWQAQAPGEPAWESPWGPGRPGWHIECSSMSMHYLGEQIDIHGGGADLTFPHHTCEIAQSENYSGKAPFVNTWMHVGMVYQEGEKMSKSLGNLTLVRDMLKKYSADAIRILLQSHHYRYPWECFPEDLKIAADTAYLFTQVREMVGQTLDGEDRMLHNRFIAAMENDLNTPEAVLLLRHAAQEALETKNCRLGSEVLRLTGVLGLTA